MKLFKRLTALCLALVLTCGLLPVGALAAEQEEIHLEFTHINPRYEGIISEADLPVPSGKRIQTYAASDYVTAEEAALFARTMMKEREETFSFSMQFTGVTEEYLKEIALEIFDMTLTHTGVPTEGDYLAWQYGRWHTDISGKNYGNGNYDITYTWTLTYYTTAAEEQQVDAAVEELLSGLNLSGKSDYEKIKAVYDYICANVRYDHDHVNDENYLPQFTAHAALFDGTAVCQGYSVLLYRLALELGIDCRFIAGLGNGGAHGWNIVELDNLYYNADSTWDEGQSSYSWFLKCPDNFPRHVRNEEYDTSAFHSAYPMASADYVPHSHSYTSVVTAPTCTEKGYTTYTCSCGNSYVADYVNATGHSFGSWYQTQAPTETATGLERRDCANCDHYETQEIPVLEHTHNHTAVVTAPTCTEKGYTTYTCSCGDSYVTDHVNATGHSFGSWQETKAPTEEAPGEERRDCANCDHFETQEIPVLEHTHNHTAVVTAPTCTEKGYTTYTCACGDSYVADYVNATGHSFGSWYQTQAPTEEAPGEERRDCNNCDHYETRTIDKLEPSNPTSGTCGDNLTWNFNETTGKLSISGSGEMYGADQLGWTAFSGNIRSVEIGSGATSVGAYAFADCTSLNAVQMPDTVMSIAYNAFENCSSLKTVDIPEKVMEISYGAFMDCTSLASVELPQNVMSISYHAFDNCTSLSEVEFPTSLAAIQDEAFGSCTGLDEMHFTGNAPEIQSKAFSKVTADAYYPADNTTWTSDVLQNYGGTLTWIAEGGSVEPDNSCGENITWEFEASTGTLTISGTNAKARSNGISIMDDYARPEDTPWYQYQDQIITVVIESTVDSIGKNAFAGCSNLTTVIIEEGVSEIHSTAFSDCEALENCYFEGTEEQWESLGAEIGETTVHTESAEPETHVETKKTVAPTCTEQGYDLYTCSCGTTRKDNFTKPTGHSYTAVVTKPTCTEKGYTTYTCSCGDTYTGDEVAALDHDWDEGTVTREPSAEAPGIRTFHCERCEETKTEEIPYEAPVVTGSVSRISGKDRVKTALSVAKALKDALNADKFDAVIIATGINEKFADALAGSYLANVKGAPILLYTGSGLSQLNVDFIEENLKSGGTVYILGGTGAIPATVEDALPDNAYTVKRLYGKTRYETNLAILKEAGVSGADEILVATGTNFADSLSASAVGLPLLLVNGKGTSLTDAQIEFLKSVPGKKITILGGTGAVSEVMEAAIESVTGVEAQRISGKSRQNTSVKIAEKYFGTPEKALLTYAWNFPDGLAGGPLAYALGAPLLLTSAGSEDVANEYIAAKNIETGYVLGGDAAVSDETAQKVFGLSADTVISKAYYTQ